MYSKWIDEDDAELELDEQQEKDLREQFSHMSAKIKTHSSALTDKASSSQLDLIRAAYVSHGVKYIGLVSLVPFPASRPLSHNLT